MNDIVHDDACMQALSDSSSNAFVFLLSFFLLSTAMVVEFTWMIEPR